MSEVEENQTAPGEASSSHANVMGTQGEYHLDCYPLLPRWGGPVGARVEENGVPGEGGPHVP